MIKRAIAAGVLLGSVLQVSASSQTLSTVVATRAYGGQVYEFRRGIGADALCTTGCLTWDQARQECETGGGHLATITSSDEQGTIHSLLDDASAGGFCDGVVWIGLTDEAAEGIFRWITGESFSYSNWSPGEPNDSGGIEDWVHIFCPTGRDPYQWNDLSNLPGQAFICEGSPRVRCSGFEPPMAAGPVTAKGKNRVLPLRARLFSGPVEVTDANLTAAPVVQVYFDSGTGPAEDVSSSVLPAGQSNEGNQFLYSQDTGWRFNLSTRAFSAPGTYTITMQSGNSSQYVIAPTCSVAFVVP